MIKGFQFKSIKTRIIMWAYIFGIMAFIVFNIIFYQHLKNTQLDSVAIKLESIRDIKSEEINRWINEKINKVVSQSTNHELKELDESNQKSNSMNLDNNFIEKNVDNLRKYFNKILAAETDINEIFFINKKGKVLVSTEISHENEDHSEFDYFIEPIKTQKVFTKDVFYSNVKNKPIMIFSAPVYNANKNIGVIANVINLESSLFNILLIKNIKNKTVETFILNKNGIALSMLQWQQNAMFNLKITSIDFINASKGKTGIIKTEDYRGEDVLSAYSSIKNIGWVIITKQDINEVFSPIERPSGLFFVFAFISAVSIIFSANYHSHIIGSPLEKMIDTASRIKNGDSTARIDLKRSDEFGQLTEVFNDMADKMFSQMKIQQKNIEIAELMLIQKNSIEFANQIVKKLIEITNSNFGAFYIKDNERFVHLSSIGLNSETVRSFNSNDFEGEFGLVLSTKKISLIKNISQNTIFKFKSVAGDIIPKEIITMPIHINSHIAAIISMGRIDEYTKDDIEILKEINISADAAFSNLMANEKNEKLAKDLQNKNEEITVFNEELQHQSIELNLQKEELKQQTEELIAQRIQVEEATKLKSEFLANVSHELRTPLTSILGLSQLLLSEGTDKNIEMDNKYLSIIERNGERLLNLINDILDLSKIEAHHMDINLIDFNPAQLVDCALETITPIAEKKGLVIEANKGNISNIFSDEDKVMQILINLLYNAVKFTEQGKISINVARDNNNILFSIIDTGIGIAKEDSEFIFNEFRQVDGSLTRKYEGTGLGLAISQKLANLLKGKITVESELGSGSTFTLILPLEYSTNHEITKINTEVNALPKRKISDKSTILIVEDNEVAILQIKTALEEKGYIVDIAHGGSEALNYIKNNTPDAFILDLMMPEIDGFEVLKEIRSRQNTMFVPVLVLTAKELTKEERSQLKYNNISQLIQKGKLNRDQLLKYIEDLFHKHKSTNPLY
ncbi:response regulator [Candidatus Poribacteria bacterium]|nr:response regulator [Candidatus Poribacteria bacterium]